MKELFEFCDDEVTQTDLFYLPAQIGSIEDAALPIQRIRHEAQVKGRERHLEDDLDVELNERELNAVGENVL